MLGQMIRQGDILLRPVSEVPKGLFAVPRDNGRMVVAYGEGSGHAHVIDRPDCVEFLAADLREMDRRYLRVEQEVKLVHDTSGSTLTVPGKHNEVTVPPGDYEVVPQREEGVEGVREWVRD